MAKIDWFGPRDENSYRDEAKNILDSYAHPWDVLAELAQNAVDALDQARKQNSSTINKIEIEIDQSERSIRVLDSGIGIDNEDLQKVLRPHFSGKRGKSLRGEKGVGLTYIALVGNSFEILTKSHGHIEKATVAGAQNWLLGLSNRPEINIENVEQDLHHELQSYTQVTIRDIPETVAEEAELDIFALDFEQMAYLLRTRTAFGYTGSLFGIAYPAEVDVTLTLITKSDKKISKPLPFSFESPAERVPQKSRISLEQVKEYLGNAEVKRVLGKSIYFSKNFPTKTGKVVRAYCFLTSRHSYNQQTEDLKLPDDIRVQGGIYITTKGMPTGITLPTPKTGRAGYWPNFFLVLEYDAITLDLGRKSITAPRVIEMLGKQAAIVFNEVDRYIKFIIREDEGTLDALVSQDELQVELVDVGREATRQYHDKRQGTLVAETYPFTREPKQEQDVIAVFSMALARGLLPYQLMRLSSSYRYDSFLRIVHDKKPLTIVAEFKLDGESILKDLEEAKVRYGQLHLLICWRMNEAKLRAAGFIIDAIEDGRRELPGATHKLSFPTSAGIKDTPIGVICLEHSFIYEG